MSCVIYREHRFFTFTCFGCFAGLGESWGHVSRSSSLDGLSQELGSHLLQVLTALAISTATLKATACALNYYHCSAWQCRFVGGLVAAATCLLLPSFLCFQCEMS